MNWKWKKIKNKIDWKEPTFIIKTVTLEELKKELNNEKYKKN